MKKISFLCFVFLFLVFSCKKEETQPQKEELITTKVAKPIIYGSKFFDYDGIDYYDCKITEDEAYSLVDSISTKNDELKYKIISEGFPKNISQTEFVSNLTKIGFQKHQLKETDFSKLDKVFIEKSDDYKIDTACIPVYRDILVFKKNNKIVGIAKICFDCRKFHIVGTKADLKNFGSEADYQSLAQILGKTIESF